MYASFVWVVSARWTGHCHARTRSPWWNSRDVFPSNFPSIAPAEMTNTLRWQICPLEDNQLGGYRLDRKKPEAGNFPADFSTWKFLGWGERLWHYSIDWALSPVHNDITSFRPRSPIEPDRKSFRLHWKYSKFAQTNGTVGVLIRFQAFRTHLAESFRMSKIPWMMDSSCSRELPSFWAIGLAEIRRSSKIRSRI
jgi:hypothetical protein